MPPLKVYHFPLKSSNTVNVLEFHTPKCLTVLGFNDMSTHVGHFVSSPREREKRDSRGDEREGQARKRNRNESELTKLHMQTV